jgi:predicted CoA-substrate-specific enzyme activase
MISVGIDIGAISTKTVILNNNQFVAHNIMETGLDPRKAAKTSLELSMKKANLTQNQLNYIIATGHGRRTVEFANNVKSEIMACAKGAKTILPSSRIIIDLGGQGIRVIRLDQNGTVENFVTNDKCSSGTGCFLDAMAFALGVDLKQLGQLAENSQRAESISTKCTIFAESEVISLVARGKNMEDIISGLHDSVAKKVASLTKPLLPANIGPNMIFLAGGVGKNKGVVKALSTALGLQLFVPNDPQVVTAYGAALLASTTPQASPPQPSTPKPAPQSVPKPARPTQPAQPRPQPTPRPATQPTHNQSPHQSYKQTQTRSAQ